MYRILIAGTGFVGTAVARYFRSKNQKVWATTRSNDKAAQLKGLGIQPLVCDLTDPATLKDVPVVQFAVIGVAPDTRDPANYRKVYLEGVRNLLEQLKQGPGLQLLVYISSTGVYPDSGGAWVDENTPLEPDSERSKVLLDAEAQVLNSGLPSIVFRLGGIYGPERNQVLKLRNGEWPESRVDAYVNMIHLEDIVQAMPVLFNRAECGQVYIGVDDEPVKRSEMFAWLSEKLRLENQAVFDPNQKTGGKRCRNTKLKSLGFEFKYPNFKKGYEPLLA